MPLLFTSNYYKEVCDNFFLGGGRRGGNCFFRKRRVCNLCVGHEHGGMEGSGRYEFVVEFGPPAIVGLWHNRSTPRRGGGGCGTWIS